MVPGRWLERKTFFFLLAIFVFPVFFLAFFYECWECPIQSCQQKLERPPSIQVDLSQGAPWLEGCFVVGRKTFQRYEVTFQLTKIPKGLPLKSRL